MNFFDEFLPVIGDAPIFEGISCAEISAMLGCLSARAASYGRGGSILDAGESIGEMGLLLSGSALVTQTDFWGNRNLLAHVGPGQLFAEVFACSAEAAVNVNVTADSPCSVMWLNVNRILNICPEGCAHHSRMLRNLLSDLARKNLRLNEKLTHMGQRSIREKLLSYLSAQARKQGASEFDIPFDRQELADYLSVERSAMSAALGRLRDEGLLTFKRNHFHLNT